MSELQTIVVFQFMKIQSRNGISFRIQNFLMKKIAIFASGSGSNAERITSYFADSQHVSIDLFLSNNPNAGVIERGRRLGIPTVLFDKKIFSQTNKILKLNLNVLSNEDHYDFEFKNLVRFTSSRVGISSIN